MRILNVLKNGGKMVGYHQHLPSGYFDGFPVPRSPKRPFTAGPISIPFSNTLSFLLIVRWLATTFAVTAAPKRFLLFRVLSDSRSFQHIAPTKSLRACRGSAPFRASDLSSPRTKLCFSTEVFDFILL